MFKNIYIFQNYALVLCYHHTMPFHIENNLSMSVRTVIVKYVIKLCLDMKKYYLQLFEETT